MPNFEIDVSDLATLLAVIGCLAGAGVAAWWLRRAFRERKPDMARDALAGALMLWISAFVFFTQQQPRASGQKARTADKAAQQTISEPAFSDLRKRAEARRSETIRRREDEDRAQRAREAEERARLRNELITTS